MASKTSGDKGVVALASMYTRCMFLLFYGQEEESGPARYRHQTAGRCCRRAGANKRGLIDAEGV